MNIQNRFSNGNPIWQRGMGGIGVGGTQFNVPIALLQQMQYAKQINGANYDRDNYLSNRSVAMPYSSYGAAQGRIEDLNKKYSNYLSGSGAINRQIQADNNAMQAHQQAQNYENQMKQGVTERVGLNGGYMGGNARQVQNSMNQARQAQQEYVRQANEYGRNRMQEADNSRIISQNMYNDYSKQFTPTMSNLPITEKTIKKS